MTVATVSRQKASSSKPKMRRLVGSHELVAQSEFGLEVGDSFVIVARDVRPNGGKYYIDRHHLTVGMRKFPISFSFSLPKGTTIRDCVDGDIMVEIIEPVTVSEAVSHVSAKARALTSVAAHSRLSNLGV